MDDWIFEGGKPTMCLDKYLKSVSINGMVQKIQIRQLTAASLTHTDGNATGGVTTWQLYISLVTGTGPASYEFVVFTAVSESDRHSHAWAKCERSGLILSRENYN